jgi:hypothetical protein
MDQIVEQVCAAVRKSDFEGVRTILEGLVMTGVQDQPRSRSLMRTELESGEDRIARLRRAYDDDDCC